MLKLLTGDIRPDKGQLETSTQAAYFPYTPTDYTLSSFNVIKDAVAPFRQWQARMDKLSAGTESGSLQLFADVQEQFQQQGGYDIDGRIEKEADLIGIDRALLRRSFGSLPSIGHRFCKTRPGFPVSKNFGFR